MPKVQSRPLPPDSLLAGFAAAGDYTDCFTCDAARSVSLPQLIEAFYNSAVFRPERWALHAIGRGSGAEDVAALAADETRDFAAWSVIERADNAILLQDFQKRTCSWLAVEPLATNAPTITGRTRLFFGSGVRQPDSLAFRLLMPVHRAYAKALLTSTAKRLA